MGVGDGLMLLDYAARFGSSVFVEFPQLSELLEQGLAQQHDLSLKLTSQGMELSDAIGPWLYSQATLDQMDQFELR